MGKSSDNGFQEALDRAMRLARHSLESDGYLLVLGVTAWAGTTIDEHGLIANGAEMKGGSISTAHASMVESGALDGAKDVRALGVATLSAISEMLDIGDERVAGHDPERTSTFACAKRAGAVFTAAILQEAGFDSLFALDGRIYTDGDGVCTIVSSEVDEGVKSVMSVQDDLQPIAVRLGEELSKLTRTLDDRARAAS